MTKSSEALRQSSGEAELRDRLHSICFALRANSIGSQDLKFDQISEIDMHLNHYEDQLLDLIHQREKEARNQAQIEALQQVREKLKYLLTDYELEIIDQQIEEIEK